MKGTTETRMTANSKIKEFEEEMSKILTKDDFIFVRAYSEFSDTKHIKFQINILADCSDIDSLKIDKAVEFDRFVVPYTFTFFSNSGKFTVQALKKTYSLSTPVSDMIDDFNKIYSLWNEMKEIKDQECALKKYKEIVKMVKLDEDF